MKKCRSFFRLPIMLFAVAFVLLQSCSSESRKSVRLPEDWYLETQNIRIRYIDVSEDKPGYQLNVDRKASKNPDYIWYVTMAESIYPSKDQLKNIKNTGEEKSKAWYFENRWWAYEKYNKKIPYALTKDTLVQYLNYYVDFKKKLKAERKSSEKLGNNENRVRLNYKVSVIDEREKKQELTVILKMQWYQYCGIPCGWGFEKERKVVFKDPYTISRIEGDAEPKIWINSRKTNKIGKTNKTGKNNKNPFHSEWFTF